MGFGEIGFKGSRAVFGLPKGMFCFLFYFMEDIVLILSLSPHIFGKQQILLYKCHPGFKPKSHMGGGILTWVHLLGLPLEF